MKQSECTYRGVPNTHCICPRCTRQITLLSGEADGRAVKRQMSVNNARRRRDKFQGGAA